MIDDSALYDADYFGERDYGIDPRREKAYALERKQIWLHAKKPGDILDIGCGTGDFIAALDDRWNKYGYEPSEYAAGIATKKGVKMFRALRTIESESMDVVVFRGTLQHINDPVTGLAQAARILRRGGSLVILATPDADSLVYRIWHNLPALDWPRNWIVFGSYELRNIIQRLNFDGIEIKHPYWSTPYASPLSDLLKFFISLFLGWRKFAFPGNMFELYAVKK